MRRRIHQGGNKEWHKRQWFDGAGFDQAKVYQAHRNMPEGTTSTLKKRQKFLNIWGGSVAIAEKERKRHIHPRRFR